MSAIPSTPAAGNDHTLATLGSVLYSGEAKPRMAEAAWVQLVRSVGMRDQIALRELYVRTHRLVFTLSLRIVANRETAQEVMLDVFHDIWRRAPAFKEESSGTVIGWIMNLARSRAIDRLRFEHRKKRTNVQNDGTHLAEATEAADNLLTVRERGAALRLAMAVLTPREHEAIEMAFFSGCTYAEVAERLKEPPGTIKTRIRTGLMKLRAALAAQE